MMGRRAKTFWTIFITGSIAVLLPLMLIRIVRSVVGPLMTNDNAETTFGEFRQAVQKNSIIHDPQAAASIAAQAYQEKTKLPLLDGWSRPMHIYADVHGSICELNIQSAGPDGVYGTSDDVTIHRAFDIAALKAAATQPAAK